MKKRLKTSGRKRVKMEDNNLISADKALLHMNFCNRRMLIALVSMCVTFLLIIIVFVFGYTVRERNWMETILKMQTSVVTEVADGTMQR